MSDIVPVSSQRRCFGGGWPDARVMCRLPVYAASVHHDEVMISAQAVARFSSLMLSALSTGVFFGTRTSLGPSTKDFTPSTYVEVQQATIRNLRPVMGALLPAAVVANAVVVILSRRDARSTAFGLASGGLAAQVATLTLTAAIELPINAQVLTWAPDEPPHGWEATRDRWAWVHTARTMSSLVGLTCLAGAAFSDHSSQ